MQRERYVTLETHRGSGRIWQGSVVVVPRVRYEIRITQRIMEIKTLDGVSEVPGLGSIDGWLSESVPFNLIGESVELELEDGRRWECFIQSSDGNLVNRGGLHDPPARSQ